MKTLYKFPITIIIIVSSGSSSSSSSSSCSNPQPVRIVPEEDIYVELFCVLFLVSVFVLSCVRDRTCEAGRERERERGVGGWGGGGSFNCLFFCRAHFPHSSVTLTSFSHSLISPKNAISHVNDVVLLLFFVCLFVCF